MNISVVLNFVFFQGLWFSCVVGAGAYGLAWLAVGAMAPLAGLTWFSQTRRADVIVAASALCAGLVIDNLWVLLGILAYPDGGLAPFWIALLWIGLGLTVNHSMALFRDRTLLGSCIVGIAAPVTYLAGERFGAVVVANPYLLPLIAPAWMGVFYFLSKLALRLVPEKYNAMQNTSFSA